MEQEKESPENYPPVLADSDALHSIVAAISDYMLARQVAAYTEAADFHPDHDRDIQLEALQRSAAKDAQDGPNFAPRSNFATDFCCTCPPISGPDFHSPFGDLFNAAGNCVPASRRELHSIQLQLWLF